MKLPVFEVELDGSGRTSRVWMDGVELSGLRAITINNALNEITTVTITFAANGVNRRQQAEAGQK